MTDAQLRQLISYAPYRSAPHLLWQARQAGDITNGDLARLVSWVWGRAGADRHTALTRAQWRQLFTAAGFTRDGQPDTAPHALNLYRGSSAKYRANWSWTERLDVAEGYARQHDGQVWTLTAPSSALLAYRSVAVLNLDEYVVDTHGLEIHPHP